MWPSDVRCAPFVSIYPLQCTIFGFKLSAASHGWHGFLAWQVAGNLAGFAGVLVLIRVSRGPNPLTRPFPVRWA